MRRSRKHKRCDRYISLKIAPNFSDIQLHFLTQLYYLESAEFSDLSLLVPSATFPV